MSANEYAIVGRIRKPHGIRGEVTVELVTDEPHRFFAPGARVLAGTVDGDLAVPRRAGDPGSAPLEVETSSPFRDGLIAKFDVIEDRTAADVWRGRYLLVPVKELTPPADDEVFVHDLVGMRVLTKQGLPIGDVVAHYDLPQGLMLEVKRADGSVLVPYRPEIVLEVDLGARTISVDDTQGLFD